MELLQPRNQTKLIELYELVSSMRPEKALIFIRKHGSFVSETCERFTLFDQDYPYLLRKYNLHGLVVELEMLPKGRKHMSIDCIGYGSHEYPYFN